jgi:hypothetical protein
VRLERGSLNRFETLSEFHNGDSSFIKLPPSACPIPSSSNIYGHPQIRSENLLSNRANGPCQRDELRRDDARKARPATCSDFQGFGPW